jgi:hypothetical protein
MMKNLIMDITHEAGGSPPLGVRGQRENLVLIDLRNIR